MKYSEEYSKLNLSQSFVEVLKSLQGYRLFPFILDIIRNPEYFSDCRISLQGDSFIFARKVVAIEILVKNKVLLLRFVYEVESFAPSEFSYHTFTVQVSQEEIILFTSEDIINDIKMAAMRIDRVQFSTLGRPEIVSEKFPMAEKIKSDIRPEIEHDSVVD